MSTAPAKLSKKQQKALKHRSRSDKGKGKAVDGDDEAGAVPEQDLEPDEQAGSASAGESSKGIKLKTVDDKKQKKSKSSADDGLPYSPLDPVVKPEKSTEKSGSKKRKRDEAGGKNGAASADQKDKPVKPKQPKSSDSKHRYIVFVGNLPYKVDAEDVTKHFEEACSEKPSVRLLTTKPPTEKQMNNPNFAAKSKGCAFVEFKTSSALQAALHLHQSTFISSKSSAKRKINVELTAGGGGNSETRKRKLGELKERLDKQREKHKTEADVAKSKKEEDQKAVREEWKKNEQQMKVGRVEGQPAAKKRRAPKFVSGANSTKLG